jgi:hypothetical protein
LLTQILPFSFGAWAANFWVAEMLRGTEGLVKDRSTAMVISVRRSRYCDCFERDRIWRRATLIIRGILGIKASIILLLSAGFSAVWCPGSGFWAVMFEVGIKLLKITTIYHSFKVKSRLVKGIWEGR